MSAPKKRVFDKDLGVELVLDDEVETAKSSTDQTGESRSRKRAKFETNNPSIANQTTYSRVEQDVGPGSSNLGDDGDDIDSDSENYEDIDYGDDDDDEDQDFNNDHHNDEHGNLSNSSDHHQLYDGDEELKRDRSEYENEQEEDEEEEERDQGESSRDPAQRKLKSKRVENNEGTEHEKSALEKCKYWPSCNAGDDCSYYHPTKPCRAFPNCRFGNKCLYIHPPCKFAPCTRPNCPFAHPASISSARFQKFSHPQAVQQPLAPRCKYGFNCMNLMCKFSHQRSEPCRFGANCLLDTCAFTHPSDVVRKKPANAFKWNAQS